MTAKSKVYKDPNKVYTQLRMPKDMWNYVRNISFEQNISMNDFIIRAIKKDEDNRKKLLTNYDNVVV